MTTYFNFIVIFQFHSTEIMCIMTYFQFYCHLLGYGDRGAPPKIPGKFFVEFFKMNKINISFCTLKQD